MTNALTQTRTRAPPAKEVAGGAERECSGLEVEAVAMEKGKTIRWVPLEEPGFLRHHPTELPDQFPAQTPDGAGAGTLARVGTPARAEGNLPGCE